MSQQRKFAHIKTFDYWGKTKMRCVCSCGKQSPVFKDTDVLTKEEQSNEWFLNHHGVREIRPKVRLENGYEGTS